MADKTFVFVGDTEVGSRLSQSLNAGGFSTAASLSDADVVFTYYETQQGLEESLLRFKRAFARYQRRRAARRSESDHAFFCCVSSMRLRA